MDGIGNILKSVASLNSQSLDIYLDAIEECQSFQQKNDEVIQTITSYLNKASTRIIGLQLLDKFLDQCMVEVLEDKASLWTSLALKACNRQELTSYGDLVYGAIEKLATRAQNSVELTKSFSNNYLTKVYESLAGVPNAESLVVLNCVKTCLRLYPGPSGPSRGTVERYLNRLIDNNDREVANEVGKCVLLLQQVRGGGVQGMNHKTQWHEYHIKLIGSIHEIFNVMYAKCSEIYDDPVVNEKLSLPLPDFSDDPVQRTAQLYIRLSNLLEYLRVALIEPFPVAKQIVPKKILNVISRGLGVTSLTLQKTPITDNLTLSVLIPTMHVQLLEVLKSLILILKGHLKLHTRLIIGLLLDVLQWTSSMNSTGRTKSFIKLRCKAYDLLTLWCLTMQSGSLCETISELLVNEIFYDAMPFQSGFTLKVLSGARKHMSKKARKQLQKSQNNETNISQTHSNASSLRQVNFSNELNQPLCVSSLRCLQNLLLSASNFMKPTVIKIIQTNILQICSLFYDLPLKREQLYYSWECRNEAYKVLSVLIMAPHHLCPPPTQIAIQLLQTGATREKISYVHHQCSAILNSVEKLVHPQKEGLLFPIDRRDIRNAFIKLGQENLLDDQFDLRLDHKQQRNSIDSNDNDIVGQQSMSGEQQLNVSSNNTRTESNSAIDTVSKKDYLQPIDDNSMNVDNNDRVDDVEAADGGDFNKVNEANDSENDKNNEIGDNSVIKTLSCEEDKEETISSPTAKKPKLETVKKTSNIIESNNDDADTDHLLTKDDNALIADLEAAFVDELN